MKNFDDFVNEMESSDKFNSIYQKNVSIHMTDDVYEITSPEGMAAFVNKIQRISLQTSLDYLREYHNWLNRD